MSCKYCCQDNEPIVSILRGSEALKSHLMIILDDSTMEINYSLDSANIVLEKQHIVFCPMCGTRLSE